MSDNLIEAEDNRIYGKTLKKEIVRYTFAFCRAV